MTRFPHTPFWTGLALCVSSVLVRVRPAVAQAASTGTLLDALSLTVQLDSTSVARGSMRFRQYRTGNDVELVASGIVVRRGLRVSAELRTDSLYGLRRYSAESRDSSGRLVDRIVVTSAGGRVTLERVSPRRRTVREYLAQRELVIIDSAAIVPFVALAGRVHRDAGLAVLDVRRGTLTPATAVLGEPVELAVAEVIVTATPVTVSGLPDAIRWWRDAKGHLLRVIWGDRSRVMRDDPPT